MATRDSKSKNLDNAMYQIEKQFGKGSIMRLGSHEAEVGPGNSYRGIEP